MKTLDVELSDGTYYLRRPPLSIHLDLLIACRQFAEGIHNDSIVDFILDKLLWAGYPPDRALAKRELDKIVTSEFIEFVNEMPTLRELPSADNAPALSCGDDWIDLLSIFPNLDEAWSSFQLLSRWDLTAWLWRRNVLSLETAVRKQFYYSDEKVQKGIVSEGQRALNEKLQQEHRGAYSGDMHEKIRKLREEKYRNSVV